MRKTTVSAVLAALVAVSSASLADEVPSLRIAIERQPLAAALNELARQARIQILRRDEDVSLEGLMSPNVAGELSVEEALQRVLSQTDLTYERVNERTVRIVRAVAKY